MLPFGVQDFALVSSFYFVESRLQTAAAVSQQSLPWDVQHYSATIEIWLLQISCKGDLCIYIVPKENGLQYYGSHDIVCSAFGVRTWAVG